MRLSVIAIALALVSGCGQKGALYLPPHTGTVVTRPADATVPQQPNSTAPQAPTNPTPQDASKKDEDNSSARPK